MNNIPTMTKNLLIVNFLAFAATWVLELRGIDLTQLLGLHFFLASDFQIYQFFTYMFLHGGFTHIFFNMFALWMFGSVIERVWGPKKFIFYYIVCGIGAGITQELVQYATYTIEGISAYQYVSAGGVQMTTDAYINLWTTIGASGAVYGILLAFGMIFPNERLFIIPFPFPHQGQVAYRGLYCHRTVLGYDRSWRWSGSHGSSGWYVVRIPADTLLAEASGL